MNYISFTVSVFTLLVFVFLILSTFGQQQAFMEVEKSLWSSGTPMPTPRTEVTATSIEDNIYVVGGLDKSGKVLDTVEVYNIKNNSWKTVSQLPQPLHHTAASSFNGKIYVIGGSSSPIDDWIPTNKLFIYDPIEDNWIEGKPMPTARGSVNANFVNGILYVVGGYGSSQIVDVNEAYDPSSNEWVSKSPMPTPRHHATSAVVDEQLFVMGGRIVGLYPIANTNITERYDPKEDKWITLEAMPSKRSGISAASVNNNTATSIYVFGGEDLTKTYNNNEKYDVKNNKWESQEPMPTARHGLAAVTDVNYEKIYVIGGGPASGLSVTNVNEIFNIRR
jgi:N-acetylneuraminic acid mutarotase